MSYTNYISLIALCFIVQMKALACGEDAGNDFDICFNELPHNLVTPANTHWTGTGVSLTGEFNPSVPGTYTLTLVTDSPGCQDTDDIEITVMASPSVNAGADQIVCVDTDFQINALASSPNGGIVVWSWSGDDQYLSSTNIPNPVATPQGSASFNLSVVDQAGCFSFDQLNLTVVDLPVVDAGSDLTICHGTSIIDLEGLPSGGAWAGPGVSGDEFVSPGEGTHNLEYTFMDANNCENSDQLSITVNPIPSIDAGSDIEVCVNEGEFDLSGFSPSSGITWSGNGVTDAQEGTVNSTLMAVGTHSLTMSLGQETCYVEDDIALTIKPLPEIEILSEYNVCTNELSPVLEDNSPTGGHWLGSVILDMTSGAVDMTGGVGAYPVSYAYTDAITQCADTVTTVVNINDIPEALFTLEPLDCVNADLQITNTSEAGLSAKWFVDNVEVSTDFSPSIVLSDEDVYSINLQVQNEHGCFDEGLAMSVEVIYPPVAAFTLDENSGCEPFMTTPTNESTGSYTSFEWDYTIGTSNLTSPGNLDFGDITEDATFPISLTATNVCGSHTELAEVTAFALPEAVFHTDITTFCSPVFVGFENESVNNPDSYFWDLGDGETTPDETPANKVYTTEEPSEEFEISLTATNNCGSHTISEVITVLPNPVTSGFTASTMEACAPVSIDFTDSSSGATDITYDFGDFELIDASVSHTYMEPGTYLIKQYATDGCGFDTTEVSVLVYPEPIVGFTMSDNIICQGNPVEFTQTGEELQTQDWLFGNEGTSVTSDPSFIFNELGVQTINFEAITALNGCHVELSQDIEVMSPPVLDFQLMDEDGCAPFELRIEDASTNFNQISWELNGITQFDGNTTFELTEPGFYDIEVSAINAFGCIAEHSEQNVFELFAVPEADFSYAPESLDILYNSETQFQYTGEGGTLFNWEFGDGDTSFEENPIHTFSEAGVHPVTLTSFNDHGCSSSMTMGVLVEDEISVFVPNSFTPNGDGLNDVFLPVVAGSDYHSYTFHVYDRWGNIIFESHSPSEAWLGNVADGEHYVQNGSYTWELILELNSGQGAIQKQGVVSIFR